MDSQTTVLFEAEKTLCLIPCARQLPHRRMYRILVRDTQSGRLTDEEAAEAMASLDAVGAGSLLDQVEYKGQNNNAMSVFHHNEWGRFDEQGQPFNPHRPGAIIQ